MHDPACGGCRACDVGRLGRGKKLINYNYVVALAGNPNTGKSTIFNALTGLRQRVGNWPGKTVVRAEGVFQFQGYSFKVVDLPGTYSLLSQSADEEIARDFLLFGRPDVTVVVVDASCLERNLNLVLQVLEITDHAVIALNLMDEAGRKGLRVDDELLSKELGVPVVPMAARYRRGVQELLRAIHDVATGKVEVRPHRIVYSDPELEQAVEQLEAVFPSYFPDLANSRWVALRLLEADQSVEQEVRRGTLGLLAHSTAPENDWRHPTVYDPATSGNDLPVPPSSPDSAGGEPKRAILTTDIAKTGRARFSSAGSSSASPVDPKEPGPGISDRREIPIAEIGLRTSRTFEGSHAWDHGKSRSALLRAAGELRKRLGDGLHDRVTESIYAEAERIASSVQSVASTRTDGLTSRLDRILTGRFTGFPVMFMLFVLVFWITIAGANYPSSWLGSLTTETMHGALHDIAKFLGLPWWLKGLLIDGVYLAMAWVFSVMFPPMAIFFPLFTLLEDFGYLPRVAFNLDRLFKSVGAHGKQSLTMMMGYGCNAVGVVSTRIIDSPRERLIAIITNNFSICNGRWPLLILIGTIFLGATASPGVASLVAAGSVVAVAIIGILFALAVSKFLSRTWLKSEPSAFSLELPPYRPPRLLQTLYTSFIDRTLIVLKRAMSMAAPAGALIWLIGNVHIGGESLAAHLVHYLNPIGLSIGLNGVILLAYAVAIPANEIVIPTIMMLTVMLAGSPLASPGVMTEFGVAQTRDILTNLGGWTLLTGMNLMLFSLLHNPCSTTLLTIWNETRSLKWTAVAALLPLAIGFFVCYATATAARILGWV